MAGNFFHAVVRLGENGAFARGERLFVRADYVELTDAETLHELTDESRPALLAVAAWFGDVRLIDNIELARS